MNKLSNVFVDEDDMGNYKGMAIEVNGFRNALCFYEGMTTEEAKKRLKDLIDWIDRKEN